MAETDSKDARDFRKAKARTQVLGIVQGEQKPLVPTGHSCKEPGCGKTAVLACQHKLGGRLDGATCGRGICVEHAGIGPKNKTPLCGPHKRHPEARGFTPPK